MSISAEYLNKARVFVNAVRKMQEEVKAGAEFDRYKAEYEKRLKLPMSKIYTTIEGLHHLATNGSKEAFSPVFQELDDAYKGFDKWPFTEIKKEVEETRKNEDISDVIADMLK